jgi:hypothetical protein
VARSPFQPADRGSDRQVRYGRILGLFFCLAGFVTIGFGWNGMAKVACPDCQLPYLLSGGATGLGLILVGSTLLLLAQIREERMKLAEQLREVGTTLGRAVSIPAIVSAPESRVLAGRSTYHRPGCRLVEGKMDLEEVSVDVARLSGLSPCRVCRPPEPDQGNGRQVEAIELPEAAAEGGGGSDAADPERT